MIRKSKRKKAKCYMFFHSISYQPVCQSYMLTGNDDAIAASGGALGQVYSRDYSSGIPSSRPVYSSGDQYYLSYSSGNSGTRWLIHYRKYDGSLQTRYRVTADSKDLADVTRTWTTDSGANVESMSALCLTCKYYTKSVKYF